MTVFEVAERVATLMGSAAVALFSFQFVMGSVRRLREVAS